MATSDVFPRFFLSLQLLVSASPLLFLLSHGLQAQAQPLARSLPCSRSLSFHLLLQPPLNLHKNAVTQQQPLTGPHIFNNDLLVVQSHGNSHANVGSATGLFLADPADVKKVRYLYFTATLQRYSYTAVEEGGSSETLSGSLVIIGSVSAGSLSIIGGTGDFAFAVGQAKVAIKPVASAASHGLTLSLDVDLTYEQSRDVDHIERETS